MARDRSDIYEDHDEVSEAPPERLSAGLVILTTVVLLVAIFFMQKALDKHYDAGMFADKKGSPEAPPPAE
jgi:hypothetical protein